MHAHPPAPAARAVQSHYPFISQLLLDLFAQGELPNVASITVEPKYGHVGRIVYYNGSVRLYRNARIGINGNGTAEVIRDKAYTKFFLQTLGYATPRGETFLLPSYFVQTTTRLLQLGGRVDPTTDTLYSYLSSELGYPCYIKPNAHSQGRGVYKCLDEDEVAAVVARYQAAGVSVFLVEEAIPYPDYRVVVLRDAVVACYLRKPLVIVGDGAQSVQALLAATQARYQAAGRTITIKLDDPRIATKLGQQGYTLDSVLPAGAPCQVYDISNLGRRRGRGSYRAASPVVAGAVCARYRRDGPTALRR